VQGKRKVRSRLIIEGSPNPSSVLIFVNHKICGRLLHEIYPHTKGFPDLKLNYTGAMN
jgi:hypothetical protein